MKKSIISIGNNLKYKDWLSNLKGRIRQSQIKASLLVNETLLRLYWEMGHEITECQKKAKWGSNFLAQLSQDLQVEFPEMKGFSLGNLKHIRHFYQFYSRQAIIGSQVVSQIDDNIFRIPWGHHVMLISKCKTVEEALFYVYKTIDGNWSRNTLLNILETNLYKNKGKAITNFQKTLQNPMGNLAQQTLKDPYIFDFLTMRQGYDERELENSLTDNITHFFVGTR